MTSENLMTPGRLLHHGCLILTLAGVTLADDPPWVARSKGGMVASDSPEASRAGADVLKAGGNAFDAAIATSFALSVARQQSTGIAGGGFMLAYVAAQKKFVALDFREAAPEAATPERYAQLLAKGAQSTRPSVYGGSAVGVPGQVAGLAEIHRRYARKTWQELVAPAVQLARDGFVVDEHLLEARDEALKEMDAERRVFEFGFRLHRWLKPKEGDWQVGQRLKRPRYARALELIAERGPRVCYEGPIADDILQAVKETGGEMTPDDLLAYAVLEREPLRFGYADYELVGMPPPASGGVWMAEMLNLLTARDYARLRAAAPHDARHVLIEAMKHAFADRARYLGDPDHHFIPVERLMAPDYAALLAERIFPRVALDAPEYGSTNLTDGPATQPAPDDRGTSHFCVADAEGNVVALTETINGRFGSYVMTREFGIVLNNELDDFVTASGKANQFGLVEGDVNLIGPGRRPLSSMSPTIILKNGRPVFALGGSGGPRILSATLNVALELMHGTPPAAAVSGLRVHHQWTPADVSFDQPPPAEVTADLQGRGHTILGRNPYAVVQALAIEPDGTLVGVSDPRKGGRPAGP